MDRPGPTEFEHPEKLIERLALEHGVSREDVRTLYPMASEVGGDALVGAAAVELAKGRTVEELRTALLAGTLVAAARGAAGP